MSPSGGLGGLQQAFGDALLGGDDRALLERLAGDEARAGRRLEIYQRSVRANLGRALRGAFPVVDRLVGDAFFLEAAWRFAIASPPASGDLNAFGRGFADFLATYSHARSLAWLADVARLEWAVHEAGRAADDGPIDLGALSRLPEDRQPALRLRLHPSVRIVRSPWPVLAIWEANQPDRDGTPSREDGADEVLVWRDADAVRAGLLAPEQAVFLEAVAGGQPLERLAESAGERLPDWLRRFASDGVISGFVA